MQAYHWARFALLCVGIFSFAQSQLQAAPKAATVLPQTIKSYVSIPDYDQASANFDETQIGKMMADPVMKPFTDDLKEQIKQKLIAGGVKLGINLDDLKDVYAGEICFANDQPNGAKSDGVVLTVDVTGKKAQVDVLLAKISKNQKANGAKESKVTVAGVQATKFVLPPNAEKPGPNEAYYAIQQDLLIATDSSATLTYILGAIAAAKQDNLASLEAFKAVLARAAEGRGPETYDFEWFVEPFGYAEVIRSQQGGRKKRGTDMLQLLRNQGFDAVKGLGGYVNFKVADDSEQLEMVHSSFVYAPQDPQAEQGERFRLGARVLTFPNDENFQPYDFVPEDIATFLDFRWNVQDAFKFSETIVNEYADDEIFDELIESLEKDPAGPKVNVPNQIVQHLDEKVCMIVDVKTPITPQSEQRVVGVHLLHADPVKAAITQIMKQDPNAEKHVVGEEEIWEIHEEEEEIPTLVISGPGFPDAFAANNQFTQGNANKPAIPNAAVAVVDDWLYFGNNKELIKKVILTKQAGGNAKLLGQAGDYQRMDKALGVLGSGADSFRHFARTDQAARVTYELMQQGKMPESESALGKIINELWSMGQDDDAAAKREQQIDASKLPPFAQVEGYLGPTGSYARTEDDGWYVSGAMLKK